MRTETAKLWQDVFGLEVALDTELESQGVRGVIFPLDNCEIELLQPTREGTGIAQYLEQHGEGFHHICFESTDVATDLQAAAAAGLQMIDTEPRQGLTGMIGFIHPRSNHGVLIEYAQPPADAPQHRGPTAGPGPHALHHMTVAVNAVGPVQDEWTAQYGLAPGRHLESEALGLEAQFLGIGPTDIELVRPLPGSGGPLPRRLEQQGRRHVHAGADGARRGGVGGIPAGRARLDDDGRERGCVHLAQAHVRGASAVVGGIGPVQIGRRQSATRGEAAPDTSYPSFPPARE